MTRARRLALLASALLLIAASPHGAVSIKTGDHPGYGRLVLDFGDFDEPEMTAQDGQVTLAFSSAIDLARVPRLPRNVRAIAGDGSRLVITTLPGALPREAKINGLFVVDILDPPASARDDRHAPVAAAKPDPEKREPANAPRPPPSTPAQGSAEPKPDVLPPAPASPATSNPTAATVPASAQSGPVALQAQRLARPARGFVVPFGPQVGAAAFRSGGSAVIVFDEKRPIDLAALHDDSLFGGATAQVLGAATVIRMALPQATELRLARGQEGWIIAAIPAPVALQAMVPRLDAGRLTMPTDSANAVVAIGDTETGGTLFVGTQRAPGDAMLTPHRAPEFALLPTWQGVAVEPLSDRLTLRAEKAGFVLAAQEGGPALALDAPDPQRVIEADAAVLTRRFDFPALSAATLEDLLQSQSIAAARAPPLVRLAARKQEAETLLAMGRDVEAEALLQVAGDDDPRAASDPDIAGLKAIAALLAGRVDESAAIDDPALDGSDEMTLWRAVRRASTLSGGAAASAQFAASAPLIAVYPQALRDRIAPIAGETMARNGDAAAARRLLVQFKDAPGLALAAAMLQETDGEVAGALASYDALAAGRDRWVRIRAASRAAELRLATGGADASHTADKLEKLLIAWRGDETELALRLRIAELRQAAGNWRAGLAMLRDTEVAFPDRKNDLHARQVASFDALLARDAAANTDPLELAALAEENVDLIPAGPAGEAFVAALADKLIALDLPGRAEPLLRRMMSAAEDGPGRAGLGARLAELYVGERDARGALAALADSAGDDLPPDISERRTLILARAQSAGGDVPRALAALSMLDSQAADATRADILEQARDWPQTEIALSALIDRSVPPDGALDPLQQHILLRFARAATQAGDKQTLAHLREHDVARVTDPDLGQMFRLLTADPVDGTADLARSAQETSLAHNLPKTLEAIGRR